MLVVGSTQSIRQLARTLRTCTDIPTGQIGLCRPRSIMMSRSSAAVLTALAKFYLPVCFAKFWV